MPPRNEKKRISKSSFLFLPFCLPFKSFPYPTTKNRIIIVIIIVLLCWSTGSSNKIYFCMNYHLSSPSPILSTIIIVEFVVAILRHFTQEERRISRLSPSKKKQNGQKKVIVNSGGGTYLEKSVCFMCHALGKCGATTRAHTVHNMNRNNI